VRAERWRHSIAAARADAAPAVDLRCSGCGDATQGRRRGRPGCDRLSGRLGGWPLGQIWSRMVA